MSLSLNELKKLAEYALRHRVIPGVIRTKAQTKLYTSIDRKLGIKHKWKVGDKYYTMCCCIPKDLK